MYMQFLALLLVALTASRETVVQTENTVLFQGSVLEEKSGKPAEVRYELSSTEGQRIRGKSMQDGSFQQVLKSGKKYWAIFYSSSYYLQDSIVLRPAKGYYEEKKTFLIKLLVKDAKVDAFDLFRPSSVEMTEEYRIKLKSILQAFRQDELPPLIIIVADDAKKKDKKKPATLLVAQRIAAIQSLIAEISPRLAEKISVSGAKGKSPANVQIRVARSAS